MWMELKWDVASRHVKINSVPRLSGVSTRCPVREETVWWWGKLFDIRKPQRDSMLEQEPKAPFIFYNKLEQRATCVPAQ